MPVIYLSPSLQEYNPYLGGGTEEEYMNLLTDALEPYLRASNIDFDRNDPSMSLTQAINASNQRPYDLHLALHSNASPLSLSGQLQGTDVYYWVNSHWGRAAAEIFAEQFREIYPNPSLVSAVPTATLRELRTTRAPSVLIETAYHDNPQDVEWLRNNLDAIARQIAIGLTQYFGIPFVDPYA